MTMGLSTAIDRSTTGTSGTTGASSNGTTSKSVGGVLMVPRAEQAAMSTATVTKERFMRMISGRVGPGSVRSEV
jgi:hypothetical protein